MLNLEILRSQYKDAILDIASVHHTNNVRVFGSVVHGTATENSDLDLLVHAEKGCSLIDLCAMQRKISELLGGIKVDLLSEGEIREELKTFIINEATKL